MNKKNLVTISIILGVIILSLIILNRDSSKVSEKDAQCIGENSKIYVQLGCHACEQQEKLFGKKYKYLDKTDCFYNQEACTEKDITATPTWIISGQKYVGVQSIEKLKEFTKC